MGIKLIRTLALMALAVPLSFGVLTDAEAGTCRKAGKVWDAKANKCQNIPTTLAPAAAASAPAVAPAPAPAASQPAAVPKTEKVTGVCGPAARQYPYEATGFEGQYCQVGKPSSPHIPFPVAGSTSRWSCVPDGGEAKACEATRAEKVAIAPPVLQTHLPAVTSSDNCRWVSQGSNDNRRILALPARSACGTIVPGFTTTIGSTTQSARYICD